MEREEYKLSRLRESVAKEVSMLVGWVGKQESSHQHLQQSLLESEEPRTSGKSNQETEGTFHPVPNLLAALLGACTPVP